MKTIIEIIHEHIEFRSQIWMLAKSDLNKSYKGSALGWAWAIISPMVYLSVFWFAFSIGLRSGKPVEGYSYFLWLASGMIPWFCMRGMFSGGASALRRYTFLISKIKYPISTIPTFINIANFIVHLVVLAILLILFLVFGHKPDLYWLQLPFYMVLMFLFFNTWGLFAGVLGAFSRDFQNLVRSLTMALMWLSGIFYDVSEINHTWIRIIMGFNPITVVVRGYRNSLIYKEWFWENPNDLLCYLVSFSIMLILAIGVYKKLRKNIPDVL